jgi:hypothetical protein
VVAEFDPLVLSQRTGVIQDFAGDKQLPDIVQLCSHTYPLELLPRELHTLRKIVCDSGGTAAVFGKLRIGGSLKAEQSVHLRTFRGKVVWVLEQCGWYGGIEVWAGSINYVRVTLGA